MTTATMSTLGNLYVEDDEAAGVGQQTFDNLSERYEFIGENMSASTAILDGLGIRGTRSLSNARLRRGIRTAGGSIVIQPTPTDLNFWLPRLMWKAEVADSFALGDTLFNFGMLIDKVVDRHEYITCAVNRATFRAQTGGLLELELEIIAREEYTSNTTVVASALPVTKPTFATGANGQPWSFHEMTGTLPVATSEQFFGIEITIDNALDTRFTNSQLHTSTAPADRIVTFNMSVPFDSTHQALYRSEAGGAGTVVFTNGSSVLTFTFVDLQGPDQTPTLGQKGQEVVLNLGFLARNNGTVDNEIVITNVLTP